MCTLIRFTCTVHLQVISIQLQLLLVYIRIPGQRQFLWTRALALGLVLVPHPVGTFLGCHRNSPN
eukprot:8804389-Karenia_brevis.AAC.1